MSIITCLYVSFNLFSLDLETPANDDQADENDEQDAQYQQSEPGSNPSSVHASPAPVSPAPAVVNDDEGKYFMLNIRVTRE